MFARPSPLGGAAPAVKVEGKGDDVNSQDACEREG